MRTRSCSKRRSPTWNSRSFAVGVIIFTSCAVEALCIAFGPGAANETLPTRTFWHTVRDYRTMTMSTLQCRAIPCATYYAAENVSFVGVFMFHAQIGEHSSLVL